MFVTTLATGVKSDSFAKSFKFDPLWTRYFLEKVYKRLPKRVKTTVLDHDYTIECSDELRLDNGPGTPFIKKPGYWHFHGIIAVHPCVAERFWKDEQLNHHLARDLRSFRSWGKYRPCGVTDFLIEPTDSVDHWIRYINKKRQQKMLVP